MAKIWRANSNQPLTLNSFLLLNKASILAKHLAKIIDGILKSVLVELGLIYACDLVTKIVKVKLVSPRQQMARLIPFYI